MGTNGLLAPADEAKGVADAPFRVVTARSSSNASIWAANMSLLVHVGRCAHNLSISRSMCCSVRVVGGTFEAVALAAASFSSTSAFFSSTSSSFPSNLGISGAAEGRGGAEGAGDAESAGRGGSFLRAW